jgi:hypothetical protein
MGPLGCRLTSVLKGIITWGVKLIVILCIKAKNMPSFLQSLKYSFPPHCGLVFPDV